MQYLKEEIKKEILQTALKEFHDKGFSNASMRNIARNAGVSLGNIYRYFPSKEDLFKALVEVPYQLATTVAFLNTNGSTAIGELETVVNLIMTNLVKEYRIHLLLLMDKSKGTTYENAKNELIMIAQQKMQESLQPVLAKKGIKVENDYIFSVMAATFTEGFLIILRKYEDENEIKYLIRQLLYIYYYECENRFQ